MSGFTLKSGGVWLDSVARVTDLTTTYRWGSSGGGLAEVRWNMVLPPDYDHPALRRGSVVEVRQGGMGAGKAILSEPGRTESGVSFTATGIYREANHFLCLSAGGSNTTSVPDIAVDTAISYGWQVTRPASLSISAIKTGGPTDDLNYLDTLLTSLSIELGQRWWVDDAGAVRLSPDPTTPMWQIVPGVASPGVADDEFATHLFGRYFDGSGFSNVNAQSPDTRFGYRQFPVNMAGLGPISATRANNRLAGLLALGKARLAFTDRIQVTKDQLLTIGGQPAALSRVRAGQMVRVNGLASLSQYLNGRSYLDFVIGEAAWVNGAESISLASVDLAARSLADVFAAGTTRRFTA